MRRKVTLEITVFDCISAEEVKSTCKVGAAERCDSEYAYFEVEIKGDKLIPYSDEVKK